MNKKLVCIVCPRGCILNVDGEIDNLSISGNVCPRGKAYGIAEMTHPTRMITTTVKLTDSVSPTVPVKTSNPVPKELIFKCMEEINKIVVEAPVKCGQVLMENILDTRVNIVATRSVL